jgi:hypothetical protein
MSEMIDYQSLLYRKTGEVAKRNGCDRAVFANCWTTVEKGLPCRCEEEARDNLLAALSTPPSPR